MTNIRRFSSKEDIQEQACLWVSKLDRGLSDTERAELEAWLGESSAHRNALLEFAGLWDDMSVLNELSGLFPRKQVKQESGKVKRVVKQARWSIAAGFLLMAVATGLIVDRTWLSTSTEIVNATQKVTTGIGEQKNLTLADGSIVHLNTNSVVTVSLTDSQRDIVLLKGEAHFTVAHDSSRPFTVTAGNNTVTAVGTAFNMQFVDDNAFELVVTEGRVMVKDRFAAPAKASLFSSKPVTGEGLLMFSGEKATIKGDVDKKQNLTADAIEDDLAWQKGMIVFKGESLERVLAEIGRYTPLRFSIADETLKQRRVAGYFKVGDIEGLLSALENSFGISHEKVSETTITLSKAANS
ncbi:FecR domain-containing protein [Alteromonas sp. ASW11-19]|uniref:FecR domain-containing protein n=1 Tax=Alteromonas salexigens TaxID=2982530 RepID=A0ABT2VP91_9ALTE|nr:FecR domain-containing protein [Alteromonas salexigens]MCU7555127.1 FecR domain-containing protein [Alteromonas salexigens]